MREPFWHSTRTLFDHKRPLVAAVFGAVLSAACFGAGLGLLLPIFELLLNQQVDLGTWLHDKATQPGVPSLLRDMGTAVADSVPRDPFWAFALVMVIVAVLSIVGSTGRFIHEMVTLTIVHRAGRVWRGRLFRRLIHAPIVQVLRTGTADHISRVAIDVRVMGVGHQAILGRAIANIFNGVAAFVGALILDWQLTLLALVGTPVIAIVLRKFGKRIRKASRRALQHRARMIGALNESMGGLRVVKVHNAEGYERRRFNTINKSQFAQEMRMRRAKALAGPLIETLAQIGVMAVAGVAAWLIFRGDHSPSSFMTVLTMIAAGAVSLKPLTALHTQIQEARAAATRVYEVLDLAVEPTGIDAPQDAPPLPRHTGEIAFQNVTFTYPNKSEPALNDVSLQVPFGQTMAIVGTNGSGKTTLVSLLPRLLNADGGKVSIDGHDVAKVSLRSLRRQMAVVTQQSILFEGTIAQNIAYGRRHIRMDRITAAAKAAHAHKFIASLPSGYDTMLGEEGAGLSGGQMQRICIARAILRDPAVLILDEATSQIDADSEAEINAALRELRAGRTTFVIAHRLSTVVDADTIVVMDGGRIIDQGTHDELLKRCDMYRTLAQTQLRPSAA